MSTILLYFKFLSDSTTSSALFLISAVIGIFLLSAKCGAKKKYNYQKFT